MGKRPSRRLEKERPEEMEDVRADLSRAYGKSVSLDEAREAAANLAAFFDLLVEWDRESR